MYWCVAAARDYALSKISPQQCSDGLILLQIWMAIPLLGFGESSIASVVNLGSPKHCTKSRFPSDGEAGDSCSARSCRNLTRKLAWTRQAVFSIQHYNLYIMPIKDTAAIH